MAREDVAFQTSDAVTLRGWFFKPQHASSEPLPCIIMSGGWAVLKEMGLDKFAQYFVSNLAVSCLVYDHRGFGESDTKEGQPRSEILPAQQTSDLSDAITYAQLRPDVNKDKIGIWGSSYSGAHCLWVGAVDRRVKVVLVQVPVTDGWASFHRFHRDDEIKQINKALEKDRLARGAGEEPGRIPIIDADPHKPQVFPTRDCYDFFTEWDRKLLGKCRNNVTVKSLEALREYYPSAHIHRISPTPLLVTLALDDNLTPPDMVLEAYSRAREPKELQFIPGGHFDAYDGEIFDANARGQLEFLKKHFLRI
ncbi:uncharacterized protein Z520_02678 [Fonsecaea multimorphosa CBS 102226]|uniref:Xaa-Pro dipeptidyl-peptidase-like domain-containing protein n=1 Tax=Fonsecaea multimorphosa CBS 102226 TaxID=1442371 RepID=A0A0D2HGT1_9EURO|nr:uncharacterized protein Z520_02678 [Fonsecaea multimorphosa CBS 102226]KIY01126.1 hypothetical protein Z520_02678 [Fonsecaea multimorphosa CBS 102226]OAL28747.1 hypothetical protein AYO22_02612 [Fonsecaea multimorphosa]